MKSIATLAGGSQVTKIDHEKLNLRKRVMQECIEDLESRLRYYDEDAKEADEYFRGLLVKAALDPDTDGGALAVIELYAHYGFSMTAAVKIVNGWRAKAGLSKLVVRRGAVVAHVAGGDRYQDS